MITKQLKLVLAASAALVVSIGGFAVAKGHHDPAKRAAMVKQFDANGDGALDDAERGALREAFEAKRAARRAETLAKFDANGDGMLSDGERTAMMEAHAAKRFAALDTDGDGALSLAEFQAGREGKGGRGRMHHRGGPDRR